MSREAKIMAATGTAAALGCAGLLFSNRMARPAEAVTPPAPAVSRTAFDDLVHGASHVKGAPNAPVTVVEFADFECRACRRAATIMLQNYREADGTPTRLAFYNLPLSKIHPRALPAAIAVEAAGRQGKFWQMHDLLFAGASPQLADADIDRDAGRLGLDMTRFHTDLADPAIAAAVETERRAAADAGVTETPTFLIGRASDSNAPEVVIGVAKLQQAVSRVVASAPSASPTGVPSGA